MTTREVLEAWEVLRNVPGDAGKTVERQGREDAIPVEEQTLKRNRMELHFLLTLSTCLILIHYIYTLLVIPIPLRKIDSRICPDTFVEPPQYHLLIWSYRDTHALLYSRISIKSKDARNGSLGMWIVYFMLKTWTIVFYFSQTRSLLHLECDVAILYTQFNNGLMDTSVLPGVRWRFWPSICGWMLAACPVAVLTYYQM